MRLKLITDKFNDLFAPRVFGPWLSALVLLIVATFLSFSEVDPDLWGHLKFGLDNIEQRTIVRFDPYSYTNFGHEWINHEWAAEIVMAMVFFLGGSAALLLMKLLLLLSVFFLAIRANRHNGFSPPLLLLIFILAAAAIRFGSNCRPHMFTYAFFGVTVYTFYLWHH